MEIVQEDACHAAVGLALRSFQRSFREWIEGVVRIQVGDDWEQWCCTVRQEVYAPLESLDTPALLDIVLCPQGWSQVFEALVDRDYRSLLFDVRRHRNRWAHQKVLTLQETYRALDVIEQLLEFFSRTMECSSERGSVQRMLDDVILQLAEKVQSKRRFGFDGVSFDGDGDVQMQETNHNE